MINTRVTDVNGHDAAVAATAGEGRAPRIRFCIFGDDNINYVKQSVAEGFKSIFVSDVKIAEHNGKFNLHTTPTTTFYFERSSVDATVDN